MTNHKNKNKPAVSFWESEQTTLFMDEKLNENICVDVAIIGGGFTGLSTAREILKDQPSLRVVVLEADYVGYGASGRNGGFNMTLFGLEPEITLLRWGKQRTIEAQEYTIKAVNYVRDLVDEYKIESNYEHPGMVRVAYSDAQLKRLEGSVELFEKLGVANQYELQSQDEIQQSVHSPKFRAGLYEKNSGILNPYKHVRELKRIAEECGAKIYENTPVIEVKRLGDKVTLKTKSGTVSASKLVIAVNAWSGKIEGLPKIKNRQIPIWTSQVVTEPLSDEQWHEIGWMQRQSIEDNRQLIHYFRRTVCGRFTMGGGNVGFPNKYSMTEIDTTKVWQGLTDHIGWLFPSLKNVGIDYRWGGPVSVNLDMTPEIGFIDDERIIYSTGCIGHGVSLTQLNGRTIADLVLEKKTELTDFWIINRKAIPCPPGMMGTGIVRAIAGGLKLWDKVEERKLEK